MSGDPQGAPVTDVRQAPCDSSAEAAMEFFDLIQKRQSIRKWHQKQVERTKLNCILEAIDRAPSAGNFQSYEVYVVKSAERRKAIAAATWDQGFIAEAPQMLVFCSHPARCDYPGAETYALEDTAIACTFAMLAVTAVGLGAVWIGAFDPKAIAEAMKLPHDQIPIALLPIGYADETPVRTTRRGVEDFVHELR
jgi:nitroreductase